MKIKCYLCQKVSKSTENKVIQLKFNVFFFFSNSPVLVGIQELQNKSYAILSNIYVKPMSTFN